MYVTEPRANFFRGREEGVSGAVPSPRFRHGPHDNSRGPPEEAEVPISDQSVTPAGHQ